MGWKENESGLLVPDTPYRYGSAPMGLKRLRSLLGEKYLFAKPRRQITPGVQAPPTKKMLDITTLRVHVEGRSEESVRVLIGVAVLRSLELLPREGNLEYKGADFQRGEGTRNYDAAHRFPCTPMLNGFNFPRYARHQSRLQRALERPLERTDYLPKPVNYADRLFEVNGSCEGVVDAIGFVMYEQPVQKPVNANMIRHAWSERLARAFAKAYDDAWREADANEQGIDLLNESAVERLNELSASPGSINFQKPRANMQLVADALWYSAYVAHHYPEPFTGTRENITLYEQRLLKLSKER